MPPAEFDLEALQEYERLKNALDSRGLLEATDPRMVTMAVSLHIVISKASREIAEAEHLTFESPNRYQTPHVMIGVLANTTTRLRGLLNDMKLTPKTLPRAAQAKQEKKEAPSSKWGGILNVSG